MLLRCKRRILKEMTARMARRLARQRTRQAIISFTFDDFPTSAFTVGGTILSEYGCCGTYYAAMGLMGQTTAVGPIFSRSDLENLLSQGHELACHTHDHLSCLSTSNDEVVTNCALNRRMLAELLPGQKVENFSFPLGDATPAAKKALSSVYQTCRSIETGINQDPVDLGFLKANRIYEGLPLEPVEQLIDVTAKKGGWLIFYTHDVSSVPSAYGCTQEYFTRVFQRALASGAEILSIRDAAARYRIEKEPLTENIDALCEKLSEPELREAPAVLETWGKHV